MRAWATYDVPVPAAVGTLNLGVLQYFNTGTPYGAQGTVDTRPFVAGNPLTYAAPPSTVNYYFTARDAFHMDDLWRTDLAVNYAHKLGLKKAEVFGRFTTVNLFDRQGLTNFAGGTNSDLDLGCGTGGCIVTTVQTNANLASMAPFNPFTTQPVEGVNWRKAPTFGTPLSRYAYQTPRTFQFSLGVRFSFGRRPGTAGDPAPGNPGAFFQGMRHTRRMHPLPSGYSPARSGVNPSLATCPDARRRRACGRQGFERLRGHLASRGARVRGRHLFHQAIEIGGAACRNSRTPGSPTPAGDAGNARSRAGRRPRPRPSVEAGQRIRALELEAGHAVEAHRARHGIRFVEPARAPGRSPDRARISAARTSDDGSGRAPAPPAPRARRPTDLRGAARCAPERLWSRNVPFMLVLAGSEMPAFSRRMAQARFPERDPDVSGRAGARGRGHEDVAGLLGAPRLHQPVAELQARFQEAGALDQQPAQRGLALRETAFRDQAGGGLELAQHGQAFAWIEPGSALGRRIRAGADVPERGQALGDVARHRLRRRDVEAVIVLHRGSQARGDRRLRRRHVACLARVPLEIVELVARAAYEVPASVYQGPQLAPAQGQPRVERLRVDPPLAGATGVEKGSRPHIRGRVKPEEARHRGQEIRERGRGLDGLARAARPGSFTSSGTRSASA